jgi:glycosyltransferase involved in cell wall biosynthesis
VLAVGRLARYKGLDVLVRAARAVAGVELIVAGAGERRAALASLIGAENDGRIRLAGAVSDGVRNRLMRSCDVFCLPSRNRAEAFGMALLEAMAAGRPVIATRVPGSGMEWLVDEERTGWLVEPDDVDGLAALLSRLQAERGLLESAGARARSDFQQRFRIDAVAERVFDVYRDVLRGSGDGARG